MRSEISAIMDDIMKDDIWNEVLAPETDMVLDDLLRLSTDYSCHGCAF